MEIIAQFFIEIFPQQQMPQNLQQDNTLFIHNFCMNPSCVACQNQATRVCIYPTCEFVPFLCDNKCKNNVGEKMHIHSNQLKLIPYSQLDVYLSKLEDSNNQDFLNQLRKKLMRIQNSLYDLLERMESDLTVNVLRLSKKSISMIETILSKNHDDIKGRDINLLLEGKNIYEDQQKAGNNIEMIKKKYDKMLDDIQQILNGVSIIQEENEEEKEQQQQPCNDLVQNVPEGQSPEMKFLECFAEGIKLFQKGDSLQALKQFIIAQSHNPFEAANQLRIGMCLSRLNVEHLITQYNKAIELGLNNDNLIFCYLELWRTYIAEKKFEEAVKELSKAVQLDKTLQSLRLRAEFYLKNEDYLNALIDFSALIQSNSDEKEFYLKRSKCYSELGMQENALMDQLVARKKIDSKNGNFILKPA